MEARISYRWTEFIWRYVDREKDLLRVFRKGIVFTKSKIRDKRLFTFEKPQLLKVVSRNETEEFMTNFKYRVKNCYFMYLVNKASEVVESEKQLLRRRNRTAKITSVISVFGIIKMCSSKRVILKQQLEAIRGKSVSVSDYFQSFFFRKRNVTYFSSRTGYRVELETHKKDPILIPNRPFPSSLVPLLQSESKCETILMKMSSTCSFIFMQIKLIFIRMVSHLDSL